MEQPGEKQAPITLHRLCLIVPLAVQLSMPVVFVEFILVSKIRHLGSAELHAYFAAPYFIALLVSLFWLPLYTILKRKRLGSAAKYWLAYELVTFFPILLILGASCLPAI